MKVRRTKVDDDELFRAAFHEVGHALVSESMGLKVFGVGIRRDGSGGADLDISDSPIKDLRVTVAGYVAEAILDGVRPSWQEMQDDVSNALDVSVIEELVKSGKIRAEIAIPAAMKFVEKVLGDKDTVRRHRGMATRLVRTRYLWGQVFNGLPKGINTQEY